MAIQFQQARTVPAQPLLTPFSGLRPNAATFSGIRSHASAQPGPADRTQFTSQTPFMRTDGKVTHLVTFRGLQNPLEAQKPAIQMRVTGVTNHQRSSEPNAHQRDTNINTLADSNWKDGDPIDFEIDMTRGGRIELYAKNVGHIGRVPDEIAPAILKMIAANPRAYRFELSNLIAGMTKGAETIGLRVNLHYQGNNAQEEAQARTVFNQVLNNPKAAQKAMIYQPPTSPEEVLKLILQHERDTEGSAAAAQMEMAINNITAKLKDPRNKRILLLGHCKPDGDTLGCTAGLKQAIQLMDPTRQVDCAVDDKIPGLFRNKVPGMDEIKHPYNPEKIQQVTALIQDLETKLATGQTGEHREALTEQLTALRAEKEALQNPANLLDPKQRYDLVVTMDIPTPTRFTDKFKPYIQGAKDVVYIDHHPHRFNEWEAAKEQTGLDMAQIHNKNLAWVADAVGACAEMMTIIGNRLVPGLSEVANGKPLAQIFPNQTQQQQVARYVASLVTGMSTDTGSFTRTCNLTPDDMKKPVEQRPNFQPEGVAKWLMQISDQARNPADRINKKWLRENVTYDLPDNPFKADDQFTARDMMLRYAVDGRQIRPELSYGVVQVDYNQMKNVWETARRIDPLVNLLDVQNGFKYSEVMGTLRSGIKRFSPGAQRPQQAEPTLADLAKQDYEGSYDTSRIGILICQDKKAGELDEKLQIATQNGLRLSLRSADGTEHAELLASLFNGGGHGAAAGARVDLPGVELNTPLGVKINGVLEKNPARIYETLKSNLALMHSNAPDIQKKRQVAVFEIVHDPSGKPCGEMLGDLVAEIRKEEGPPQVPGSGQANRGRPAGSGKPGRGRSRRR